MANRHAPTHVAEAQVVVAAKAGVQGLFVIYDVLVNLIDKYLIISLCYAANPPGAAQHLGPGRGLFLPVLDQHQKDVPRQGNIH